MEYMPSVLITGATGGIGREIARLFAKRNFRLILHYNKNAAAAEALASEINREGFRCITVRADLSVSSEIKSMCGVIASVFGGTDILINNAGVSSYSLISDTDEKEWDRVFNINLKGAYILIKELLPYMLANKKGRIINIGSVWGETGGAMESVYSASKGGLAAFTKALAKELGPSGITVNCVSPGFIDTDMNARFSESERAEIINSIPLCRAGMPQDVAALCAFLASEEASYITGQIIGVNGGMSI